MATRQRVTAETFVTHAHPLDYQVLGMLPAEGSMHHGVHWAGRRITDLANELDRQAAEAEGRHPDGTIVTSDYINSRLRALRHVGFVTDKPAKGGRVWQRTQAGAEFLERRNGSG